MVLITVTASVHLWIPVGSLGRCCGITILAEGSERGHSAWAWSGAGCCQRSKCILSRSNFLFIGPGYVAKCMGDCVKLLAWRQVSDCVE